MQDHISYEGDEKKRLDLFLTSYFEGRYTRSYWQKMIQSSLVKVNEVVSSTSYKLKKGDLIDIEWPEEHTEVTQIPTLYEDNDCLVLNKPAGLLTHSKGVFNAESTVADFVAKFTDDTLSGNREGIVHRLDRVTSGVMIAAKNQNALSHLQKQFSQRKTKKFYVAIVEGELKEDKYKVEWPIARNPKKPQTFRVHNSGKSAETTIEVLKRDGNKSIVFLKPKTGRTHQLRVHLSQMGHPITGDTLYGAKDELENRRILLHAYQLEVTTPNKKRQIFTASLPEDMSSYIHEDDIKAAIAS